MRTEIRISIIVSLLALAMSGAAQSQVATSWTNTAGTGAWENYLNWNPNIVPNDSSLDVQIGIAAPCNLASGFEVRSLNLSTSASKLNLAAGSSLTLATVAGITNDGAIVVNTTNSNLATNLSFGTSGQIGGSGNIRLNGSNPGDAGIIASPATITQNATHSILGRGDLDTSKATFVNNGVVNADNANGEALRIYLNSGPPGGDQNNGTFEATNGGRLIVQKAWLLNQSASGIIFADGLGSVVQLGAPPFRPGISGGLLSTRNGGVIEIVAASLDGSTNLGDADLLPGGLLVISGSGLTNNGTIVVNPVSQNNETPIYVSGNATIDGNGDIRLNGSKSTQASINSSNGDPDHTITQGANHTIHGRGAISLPQQFINNGTISADEVGGTLSMLAEGQNNGVMEATNGGTLKLVGILDQTGGGTIKAVGGGTTVKISLESGSGLQLKGGILTTEQNGLIQAGTATLEDCTNNGELEVMGLGAGGIVSITGSGITNNGVITVPNFGLSFDQGNVQFKGSGVMRLNNGSITISQSKVVTNTASHSIAGIGTVWASTDSVLANNGMIRPGDPIGQLTVSGNLQLGPSSNLIFEIGGNTAGTQYDVLNKTTNSTGQGPLTLNGNLTVTLVNDFTPLPADAFVIITSPTPLAGSFTNVPSGWRLNTVDNKGSFLVTYRGLNRVVLSNFGPPVPFKVTAISKLPNQHVLLDCRGVPLGVHRIEASPNLSSGSFSTIGSAIADSGGSFQFEDTSAGNFARRFYRIAFDVP